MRIGLSQRGDPRGRHIVLVCDKNENSAVHNVLIEEVLGDHWPEKEVGPNGKIYFRFHVKFLERLLLALPFAELSPALDTYIIKQQKKEFDTLEVPDISVPGFYDYRAEQDADLWDFQKIGVDSIERHLMEELDSLSDEDARVMLDIAEELAEVMLGSPQATYFLNDGLGLGKTIQGMSAAIRNRWFPALYVGPVSGKWSTARIIDRFFDDDFTFQVVDGTKIEREEQIWSYADLTIVNYETIRVDATYNRSTREWTENYGHEGLFFNPDGTERVFEFAIIDEHHRCKSETAQMTKGFFRLQARRWLMMSGTPILNRIEEIWTMLHKTDPVRFPSFYLFKRDLCVVSKSGKIQGYKPEKLAEIRDFVRARSIRRRSEHVSDDLPEVVYVQKDITLTSEQRRLYNQIVDELRVEFADGSKRKVNNPLARMTRLKQACFSPELYGGSPNSAKLEAICEDVHELVASGEKAIVFSQWKQACRILERELGQYNPAYVDGTVKGKRRMAQEDKFNHDDDCKLYIGTIQANRETISLGAATYVLFADKDWVPAVNEQAAGRSAAGGLRGVHLPKGTKVHVIEYYARDTIEEWIEEVLERKQKIFNTFVERDGGVRRMRITTKDVKSLLRKAA